MALNKITDMAFRNLKASDKVQIIADGGGLIVRVREKKTEVQYRLCLRIE